MKTKIYLLLLPVFLTGCASVVRPLTDATLGAGGAVILNKLSGGDPAATAAGAAAGVLVGEGIHAWKTRSDQKAYAQGFQKGRSDGVKQLYWGLQAEHRNAPPPYHTFDVLIPAHRDGGVLINETKHTIGK